MHTYPVPDPEARKVVESDAHADIRLCWTCSTCDSECPVFNTAGRLRPQKIVRMANLGFLEDLLSLPEIWYCLTCKRCNQMCPNRVKPAAVIRFSRSEAIRRNLFSWERFSRYRDFFLRFQRVRWRAAEKCLNGEMTPLSTELWRQWLETPVDGLTGDIWLKDLSPSKGFITAAEKSGTTACFTCSECSNVCPIFFERSVFDPQWIFRMVNLGLEEEVLKSPSIWLCLACERCTEACGEGVMGHLIIQRLQELALIEGMVDGGFPFRWKKAQEAISPLFIKEIDTLLGFH
ncbi:MAG: 4Fe-4S dicluster domain-containing protein [Deltaproteobacteria bacterium]|nr:4Fe-4S dicluster domain-containing protein [Deltaproteobacteria bacterium]